jgi:hypothetical protein
VPAPADIYAPSSMGLSVPPIARASSAMEVSARKDGHHEDGGEGIGFKGGGPHHTRWGQRRRRPRDRLGVDDRIILWECYCRFRWLLMAFLL